MMSPLWIKVMLKQRVMQGWLSDWLLHRCFVIKVKKLPIIVEIKKLYQRIPVIYRGSAADSEPERGICGLISLTIQNKGLMRVLRHVVKVVHGPAVLAERCS